MKYSVETYRNWARLIIFYGIDIDAADTRMGIDSSAFTGEELYFLEEAYRERRKQEELNAARFLQIFCKYVGIEDKQLEDFLPMTEEERQDLNDARLRAHFRTIAAANNAKNT